MEDESAETIEALEMEIAFLMGQLAFYEGDTMRLRWPPSPKAIETPERAEAAAMETAESLGVTLDTVDCGEYPCLAIFSWPLLGDDADLDRLDDVQTRLVEHGWDPPYAGMAIGAGEVEYHVVIAAIVADGPPPMDTGNSGTSRALRTVDPAIVGRLETRVAAARERATWDDVE